MSSMGLFDLIKDESVIIDKYEEKKTKYGVDVRMEVYYNMVTNNTSQFIFVTNAFLSYLEGKGMEVTKFKFNGERAADIQAKRGDDFITLDFRFHNYQDYQTKYYPRLKVCLRAGPSLDDGDDNDDAGGKDPKKEFLDAIVSYAFPIQKFRNKDGSNPSKIIKPDGDKR